MGRRLALLSSQAGGGRTFIAANLAGLLQGPVTLLELCSNGSSELALHLGIEAQPFSAASLAQAQPLSLLCLNPQQGPPELPAEPGPGWLVVDGLSLDQPGWEAWMGWCGRALLVERGDLVGARRAASLVQRLEAAHFSREGSLLRWTPSSADQPLPDFRHLEAIEVPEFPKAIQRLAQAHPP